MKMLRRATSTTHPAPVSLPLARAETLTTRRVEVTIEREWTQEFIATNAVAPTSFEAHCPACGQRVAMISPAAAALLAQVTVRTIYRWVDDKKLHFLESPTGDLYLCARSLQAHPQTPVPTKQLPSGDPR